MDATIAEEIVERMLAEHPFLQGLKPHHLALMAESASLMHYDVGQYILLEGQDADTFYLIHQGEVVLRMFIHPNRGFVDIETLGSGDVVGWSWLIPPHQWHFSALVTQPTTAIALDGQRIRQKCEEDHDFGYEIYRRLGLVVGKRLRMTRKQLKR
jgi:CRP-like cAMP-binding protein